MVQHFILHAYGTCHTCILCVVCVSYNIHIGIKQLYGYIGKSRNRCVWIAFYIMNFIHYSLKGPLFGAVRSPSPEALGSLPTLPKAKAGTVSVWPVSRRDNIHQRRCTLPHSRDLAGVYVRSIKPQVPRTPIWWSVTKNLSVTTNMNMTISW